jgi:hypothetical protein
VQKSTYGTGAGDGSDAPPASAWPRQRTFASYRTICVRLCDGYYWPVNSGTRSSSIARDLNICEQSCQSETSLYIQYGLGADAGDMRDLSGKPYRKLKTAFLYRKSYDSACRCKPDPWSKPELMRHEEYRAAESGVLLSDATSPGGDPETGAEVPLTEGLETTDATVAMVRSEDAALPAEGVNRAQLTDPAQAAPRRKKLPKSVTPVLDPAAKPMVDPAKKPRDINARANR